MYSVVTGGDFGFLAIAVAKGVAESGGVAAAGCGKGDTGSGRKISWVPGLLSASETSYAIIVSSHWRNRMEKSRMRSWILDGAKDMPTKSRMIALPSAAPFFACEYRANKLHTVTDNR